MAQPWHRPLVDRGIWSGYTWYHSLQLRSLHLRLCYTQPGPVQQTLIILDTTVYITILVILYIDEQSAYSIIFNVYRYQGQHNTVTNCVPIQLAQWSEHPHSEQELCLIRTRHVSRANSENCSPPPSNNFDLEVGQRSWHGVNWKGLSQRSCMPYINALSLILQKIWARLSFCDRQTEGGGQGDKNQTKFLSPTFLPHPTPGAYVSEVWTILRWTYSPSLVTVWPLLP